MGVDIVSFNGAEYITDEAVLVKLASADINGDNEMLGWCISLPDAELFTSGLKNPLADRYY